MGLRETFLRILSLDPPPPRPTVDDYCSVEQERINLEFERDVYKRELLRLGYKPAMLLAMANSRLTEVKAS